MVIAQWHLKPGALGLILGNCHLLSFLCISWLLCTQVHNSFVVMWTICHLFFYTDLEFVKTFLYTYQSFATPEKLLKKLIERYNVVRPDRMPFQEFTMLRQTIQARVINALRLWVDLSVDFKGISVNVGLFLYVCVSVCVWYVCTWKRPKQCNPLHFHLLSV